MEAHIEAWSFFVMGVCMSFAIGVSVSSDVDCWTNVDLLWGVVILISSDDLSKLHRALFMMSSNKILMKWVFCWRCRESSNVISSTCESRFSSEGISVVERRKESKFCWVLTLVIIFLCNSWRLPSRRLLVQGKQWKYQKYVWKKKYQKYIPSMTSFSSLCYYVWTDFTHCSSLSTLNACR